MTDISKTKADLGGNTSSINESDLLINNISKITDSWIDAWEILKSRTNLRVQSSILREISDLVTHQNISELLEAVNSSTGSGVTYSSIKEMLGKFVNMHGSARTGIQSLKDEIGYFKHFVDNLWRTEGLGAYIHEMLESGSKFKGGAFGLRLLKEMPEPLAGKILKALEGKIDDLTENRFDMVFQDRGKLFNLFVETKNYKDLAKNSKFINQFKAYLRGIESFDKLVYFFNKRDNIQSPSDVKNVFQSIFKGNKKPDGSYGYEIFDDLYSNSPLRTSLWDPENFPNVLTKNQARMIFKDWVDNMDDRLFNFIRVF